MRRELVQYMPSCLQAGLGVGGQGFSYDSLRREVYTRLDQDPMGPSLSPEDDQVSRPT